MNSKSLKPLPRFTSDRQAEDFVADADLTEFDLSTGRDMLFEKIPPEHVAADDYVFVITKDSQNRFHFDVKQSSGKILFSSAPLSSREAALKAIDAFKAGISTAATKDAPDAAA
ncbi:CopG family antitoxin [Rhizobium sp. 2MFCol3.1]|uniref:CopG family antitoxin n=1 Tax=Rhizobium sp. 2MFCol3.1 TaxID=1246459 RepID=UPI000382569C|nr:CopG family antitoxin [Rhizobium sp. 2MFCol3.1]